MFKLENGKGKIREISISKIKKRIITRKNCMEKLLWEGVCESNPHSNDTHFWVSVSEIKEINFININNKRIKIILKKKTIDTVILRTSSIDV